MSKQAAASHAAACLIVFESPVYNPSVRGPSLNGSMDAGATCRRKEQNHMKKLFGFLVGIGLGMASGYVAGLLLTPASGEDLQTQVRNRINLALEEGKKAASARESELQAQFSAAKRTPLA
jgi:hypothetical protein